MKSPVTGWRLGIRKGIVRGVCARASCINICSCSTDMVFPWKWVWLSCSVTLNKQVTSTQFPYVPSLICYTVSASEFGFYYNTSSRKKKDFFFFPVGYSILTFQFDASILIWGEGGKANSLSLEFLFFLRVQWKNNSLCITGNQKIKGLSLFAVILSAWSLSASWSVALRLSCILSFFFFFSEKEQNNFLAWR